MNKVWKLDDGGKATDSVTIVLLRDGKEYRKVELSGQNGWTYTWTGLDDRYTWTAAELNVPDGFSAKVEWNGMNFIITNDDEPTNPDKPIDLERPADPNKSVEDIPQTGDETDLTL